MQLLELRQVARCAGRTGRIPCRCEEQPLHLILRCAAFRIVLCIQLFLHLIEHVDLHVAGARRIVIRDIVNEDAELTNAQFIHMLELGHQTGDAFIGRLFIGKVDRLLHGRMCDPDKAYLACRCRSGDLRHLIRGPYAVLGIFLADGFRIVLIP